MSYKNVQYGRKNIRRNYARVQTNADLPDLIEIQTKSWNWLLGEGLDKLFKEISPIKDRNEGEKYVLNFRNHEFREPKLSIEEAKVQNANYSRPLFCTVSLDNAVTGECVESDVYMGDFPMMTPWGTFVINGSERVIVTQIVRSSSVFFSSEKDPKTGNYNYSGQIIPNRGAWIEFSLGSKNIWYANLDKKSNISLVTFIMALGVPTPKKMSQLFFGEPVKDKDGNVIYPIPQNLQTYFANSRDKNEAFGPDEAVKILFGCVRPDEKTGADAARKYIASILFENRRYDLARVGRYKFNAKLDVVERAIGHRLAYDLVDPETREVLIAAGTEITTKTRVRLADGTEEVQNLVELLRNHRDAFRKTYTYDVMLEGNSVVLETLDVIVNTSEGDEVVRLLGSDQREDAPFVKLSDIFASISYFMNLHVGVGRIDDIDHLGNRRLRLIGELVQERFRMGLQQLEKGIREKMSTTSDDVKIDPTKLIVNRYLSQIIRDFFSSNQLSQFMDQINPLSELTHKRRISALGDGGITRERASFEVRDVHPSHYGRICPVETPEGQNIGLISSLASYAKANEYGFIESPYFPVMSNKNDEDYRSGKVPAKAWIINDPEKIVYLDAYEEEKFNIAQANVNMKTDPKTGEVTIVDDTVLARHNGEFTQVNKLDVDYVDVSPKQVVAVGTACIPFLEHDDTTRALMGANMQRQAIPLLKPEAPIVGTGIEYRVAHDSGCALISDVEGTVVYADGLRIDVEDAKHEIHTFKLTKYERSNNSTCTNHRPIVVPGEHVKVGDVLADGQSMDQGELALGRNVVIAFMTWNGYNFEDAVIMSERLVQDDVYTSIHIEQYTCEARETKLGKEIITRELEGEDSSKCQNLDEDGIILLGSEVKEGDTLVGKLTPKGVTELRPEEKLTQSIFPTLSKDVRITSLKVPHGGEGVVSKIERFDRKSGIELNPSVNEVVRVYIVQKRKISEGDKMSGRHGNKGVISNIVPIEDMPYMADGTPVDIMLNPQGVPSRMNIGQVLEVHLGMAAKKLGVKVATPVFDGVRRQDLIEIMNEAKAYQADINKDDKILETDQRKNRTDVDDNGKVYLYDGRTGRQFDHKICVGVMYMIKLAHMVDDKIHARADGTYTLITQQPMGGKAQNGGQRFGEMEVWALEAYGAAHTLQEMITYKSDDMIGRNEVYAAMELGTDFPEPGVPEAFRTMVKELEGLGLSIELVDQEGHEVANESIAKKLAESRLRKKSL